MRIIAASLAVVSLTALPALAQTGPSALNPNAGRASSDARSAAILECNTIARRYTQYLWGNMEIDLYRACMMQHGQQE